MLTPGGGPIMTAGMWPALGWLSFRRIVDIPFKSCVAALENWQRTGQDGELRLDRSLLRGPIEHDPDSGTCRIEVRLARGSLRPPLPMRLYIDCWSPASSRTALELIPCKRVRPSATYFRAGNLLLHTLTYTLPQHLPYGGKHHQVGIFLVPGPVDARSNSTATAKWDSRD
jgi:hypothetical protein